MLSSILFCERSGCFQCLAITNKAVDICTQVSEWIYVSSLLVNSRDESARLYDKCVFNFVRKSTTIQMRVLIALPYILDVANFLKI